jgi:hypothetical protein
MTERDALLPQSHRGIERAQSHGVFDLLDPDVRLAGQTPSSLPAPENCKVGIERARSFHQRSATLHISKNILKCGLPARRHHPSPG